MITRCAAAAATSVLALAAGLLSVTAPAQAAPAATTMTFKISRVQAVNGTGVTVSGRVTGKSAGAVVVLQRKKAGKWVSLRATKVRASQRYSMKTTVRPGVTRYRITVKGNSRIRGVISGVLKVRGVKATAPTAPATPTNPTTPTPTTPGGATGQTSAAVNRILADTNAYRATHGLAPLVLDTRLNAVASAWSRKMGTAGHFDHNPNLADELPTGYLWAGENIAAGYSQNTVVAGWIESPAHRANLLGDYTHIGIGHETVKGARYVTYSTQVFAKYR